MVVPGATGRRGCAVKIAFRTDASIQIGTGHVMRCLTLADELSRQGHECWFVCREHEGHLGGLIASKGYGLTLLPPPLETGSCSDCRGADDYALWLGAPLAVDASQTRSAIAALSADWLVVDHYALGAEWEKTVAPAVGSIMVIDDLANRAHECELLLDQNLGRLASDYDGLVPVACQRLIGPGYALLRPEFAQLREQSLQRRKEPEMKRILISLGGVDRTNVTGHVLAALAESSLPVTTELDIIMGATAPYLDQVRAQIARLPFKATVSVSVTDMAERMCLADLSIGAAGGTSWERCCLGLPVVLMIQAENQVAGAKALESTGAAVTVSDAEGVEAIVPLLLGLSDPHRLKQMSDTAADITDGNGVVRVAQAMSVAGKRA